MDTELLAEVYRARLIVAGVAFDMLLDAALGDVMDAPTVIDRRLN